MSGPHAGLADPTPVETLLKELIPHAPKLGVYVHPHIPGKLLQNAIRNYAPEIAPHEVVALLDLTFLKNAKDGALLANDRMVFQNTNLEAPQMVRYHDIVGVEKKRRMFSCKLHLDVNSGRATFRVSMDFANREKAVDYFCRFFKEAMLAAD